MRVCVVGGGTAGLCAAKYAKEANFDVTLYEKTEKVGGVWVYTDCRTIDKNGLEVHSSLYKGLRTNLPKEIMGYSDFFIEEPKNSYITGDEVLNFLNSYAKKFDLEKVINVEHHVSNIVPINESQWEVTVEDYLHHKTLIEIFDAILICNGHYQKPNLPEYTEKNNHFKGNQIHSHEYRDAEDFKDKNVLLVGGGFTLRDIIMDIAKVANRVTLSHHSKRSFIDELSSSSVITMKPDVLELTEDGVIFADKTSESYTDIIYCTGYKYTFPFLNDKCGITVDNNHTQSLFKHIVNIKHPTMMFIGIPYTVSVSQMIDIQARFCIAILLGKTALPTKDEMQQATDQEMMERWNKGLSKRQAHFMGDDQFKYYEELVELADIFPIRDVMKKIYLDARAELASNYNNFRNNTYKVIDDSNFIKTVL